MKKLIHISFGVICHLLSTAFALNPISLGSISGTVTDANTSEPIPFANVVLVQSGQQITGASTDFDGKYLIRSLKPGIYSIRVSTVGYAPVEKTNIAIQAEKNSTVDFKLTTGMKLDEVVIESHRIPVIYRNGQQGMTVGADEIRALAGRGVSSIATQTPSVHDNDGTVGSFKGSRSGLAETYIDGVKVRGSSSLPQSAYESPMNLEPIVLSGTPATTEDASQSSHRMPARTMTIVPTETVTTGQRKRRKKTKPLGLTAGYDLYKRQSFKSVFSEPLSTFSIDVDAASYSQIRRSLSMGSFPPTEIVRIEEMINYFDYDYPQPEGEHPFSITTEVADCPWNSANHLVHIGLQGKDLKFDKRPRNNLIFLIDVSGSMSSYDKLPLLKKSLRLLTSKLEKTDKISIVVYAGAAGMVLPSTKGSETSVILEAIDRLNSGGSTAGGAGIELAYSIAQKEFITGGNNRVILCTDGDFNVGVSSEDGLTKLIEKKRASGVFLTVLGFGTGNFQDRKMEQLADKGNGNFSYIDNLQEAQKVLIQEFWGTLYTIAKDVKIQVEFNPSNVLAYRLIGYENRRLAAEDFNDDRKDAGELGAGHTVTALYEVIPVGAEQPSGRALIDTLKYQITKPRIAVGFGDELLTVKLRYKQPDEDVSSLIVNSLENKVSALEESSSNLRFSAALSHFGMILLDKDLEAGQRVGQIQKVIDMAEASKGEDSEGRRAEFIRLAELTMLMD